MRDVRLSVYMLFRPWAYFYVRVPTCVERHICNLNVILMELPIKHDISYAYQFSIINKHIVPCQASELSVPLIIILISLTHMQRNYDLDDRGSTHKC